MMGDTAGYCDIKKDATTGIGTEINTFLGQTVRVMEFARDGGALVLNPQATAMAMFDKQDIARRFECCEKSDVIMPAGLKDDPIGAIAYMLKVTSRKGGYNNLLKMMVIQTSLHKGKVSDDFLFQKEREEQARKAQEAK